MPEEDARTPKALRRHAVIRLALNGRAGPVRSCCAKKDAGLASRGVRGLMPECAPDAAIGHREEQA
jgi:hypothetical protein